MAISKIMYMKDSGKTYHGMHLKHSIDYITVPEKTQDKRLVGAVNCFVDTAFYQMRETKRKFEKNNQRQGYHIVLSFKEGEVTPDTAFEITEKFVKAYVGDRYEAVYAVHDNTEHIHGHIVYNSVSFVDGKKYHYKKGDWEREIQPITNGLCQEYGLSVLEIDGERANTKLKEWSLQKDGPFVWGDMIKRDLDACIMQAVTMESFVDHLKEKGYEVKQGKYLAVKPPGMSRYKRCKSLGETYTEEAIRERILQENLKDYVRNNIRSPRIVRCHIKRYKKAQITGLQKKYFARLYRIGLLKKRAYSQVWKYKEDIRKMQKLQEQYFFLIRHDIRSLSELTAVLDKLKEEKKSVSAEKNRVFRANKRYQELFETADDMKELEYAQEAYLNGDNYFAPEHDQWMRLEEQLKKDGYTYVEVLKLRASYKQQMSEASTKDAMVRKELALGRSVWQDVTMETGKQLEKETEVIRKQDREKQPVR